MKLKEKRCGLGWSRKILSEYSGVSVRMIEKYENGEKDINKAAAITVHKIAKALGCSVDDILEI